MVETHLSTPASRREALRSVDVNRPGQQHELIRAVFDLERRWREDDNSGPPEHGDAFENIYLAALLLFLIGDPADSIRLYEAKFRTGDMDLGIGFDAQAIFGAGRQETLQWLADHGRPDARSELSQWLAQWEDPTIEEWVEFKRGYFYDADGILLLDQL